jgi:hypothetical protein
MSWRGLSDLPRCRSAFPSLPHHHLILWAFTTSFHSVTFLIVAVYGPLELGGEKSCDIKCVSIKDNLGSHVLIIVELDSTLSSTVPLALEVDVPSATPPPPPSWHFIQWTSVEVRPAKLSRPTVTPCCTATRTTTACSLLVPSTITHTRSQAVLYLH